MVDKAYFKMAEDMEKGFFHPVGTPENNLQVKILHQRLLAPFPSGEHEVRPATGGFKSRPLFYIDPRAYAKRLDLVLGLGGYSILTDEIKLAGETMPIYGPYNMETKSKPVIGDKSGLMVATSVTIEVHHALLSKKVSNVGEKSIVDLTADNKTTSAFAQAYKRAATHLGVAAYLYYITMPDMTFDKNNGFGFKVPPDDVMHNALKEVGFKRICEITGAEVSWKEAAASMHYTGRVLCRAETEKYL